MMKPIDQINRIICDTRGAVFKASRKKDLPVFQANTAYKRGLDQIRDILIASSEVPQGVRNHFVALEQELKQPGIDPFAKQSLFENALEQMAQVLVLASTAPLDGPAAAALESIRPPAEQALGGQPGKGKRGTL